MTRLINIAAVCAMLFLLWPADTKAAAEPWDPLLDDSWIGPNTVNMYPANKQTPYVVRFNDARTDNIAAGMNAFRFSATADGNSIGHFFSTAWTDAFFVRNFSGVDGGGYDYSDFLILVAIDANALPPGFSLSLDADGSDEGTVLMTEPNFFYYDHPNYQTGRPSGYYSVTDPNGEPLAGLFDASAFDYSFDAYSPRRQCETGMVAVVAFSGVSLLSLGGAVTVDYYFENLAASAAFAVYGYRDGLVKFTNRAVLDNNDSESFVSTFEVVPVAGDFDGDSDVDAADLASFCEFWLDAPCTDADLCSLADFDNSGGVDLLDLAVLAELWGSTY